MADRKARFVLLSYFGKVYKAKLGHSPSLNKYAAQWDADALLESYDLDLAKSLVDRYIEVSTSPSWKGFARDAQKVLDSLIAERDDIESRKLMKSRMEAWLRD